jgi:O-antigen/teichoic acid export membrane protein
MPPSPRRALVWSFAERYAGVSISIASAMLLSRLLTPAQVGIYSLCAAFTAVAGILRDFGVSEYLIQEKDLTPEKFRAAYGLAFAIAWTIGAAIFLARGEVAAYYAEPEVARVLAVLALNFLILPVSSPTFALLNRELAFRQIFGLQIAANLTQAVTSVLLAWFGFGVMSLAWGPIANVAAQSVLLIVMRPRECLTLPSLRNVRQVLRFGAMYVSSRTIEVLTRNFHEPVIAKVLGFASVGLFSRAFGLIELFNTNVGAAVVRVATPAFAAQHRAGLPLAEPYARATAIFVSISWPFFGFVALMAEPIIRVLFGAQWVAAAPIAIVLAISVLPNALFALAPQMLSATGQVARRLKVTLWFSPVHLAGVLIAAQFSLTTVAAVWFVTNSLMLVLYLRHLRQVLRVRIAELLRPCVGSAAVAGASVAVQVAAEAALRLAAVPIWTTIPVVMVAGALAWVVVARALRHPAYGEIVNAVTAWRLRAARAASA